MLRLLADENFNGDVVRGLLLRKQDLQLVRVQDVNLAGYDDAAVLQWAAENDRILLTHDRATMPDYACERVAMGLPMPGVFVLSGRLSISGSIEEILLIDGCSEHREWRDRVVYLPL